MTRKIIYFINPIAGTKNKDRLLDTIQKRTEQQGLNFQILPTNAANDYGFLPKKITDEKITDVVVCGGDGTVNQIVNALLGTDVHIGIIPMGSGNGLALAAKISTNIEKALDTIFAGNADYIDCFYINQQLSCMLCGLGFDAQVAHDFAKQSQRGLATYVKQTIINLCKARPYSFILNNKGSSIKADAYFMSIANSNQFGNNFTIAPKASLSDGLLDIVVVKKMNKFKMLWAILKHIRNGEIATYDDSSNHSRGILYFQTDALSISNPESALLHIDGDPAATSKEFSIQVIKKAFKLLQP